MPFLESVYIGLFIMVIVFSVLFGLYACVRLFSYTVGKLEGAKNIGRTMQP